MPKKEDIWAFFSVFGGQIIFAKKEDMSPKRRTYGKPIVASLVILKVSGVRYEQLRKGPTYVGAYHVLITRER